MLMFLHCGNIEFYRDDDSEYYLSLLEKYNAFTKQKHVIELNIWYACTIPLGKTQCTTQTKVLRQSSN